MDKTWGRKERFGEESIDTPRLDHREKTSPIGPPSKSALTPQLCAAHCNEVCTRHSTLQERMTAPAARVALYRLPYIMYYRFSA